VFVTSFFLFALTGGDTHLFSRLPPLLASPGNFAIPPWSGYSVRDQAFSFLASPISYFLRIPLHFTLLYAVLPDYFFPSRWFARDLADIVSPA